MTVSLPTVAQSGIELVQKVTFAWNILDELGLAKKRTAPISPFDKTWGGKGISPVPTQIDVHEYPGRETLLIARILFSSRANTPVGYVVFRKRTLRPVAVFILWTVVDNLYCLRLNSEAANAPFFLLWSPRSLAERQRSGQKKHQAWRNYPHTLAALLSTLAPVPRKKGRNGYAPPGLYHLASARSMDVVLPDPIARFGNVTTPLDSIA
ncbi:MAG: hypothetical protein IT290_11785 [Deltaproteobacteria bacterium]|nr:hypothetical protein [Deltaproteobacteria bacterium]